MLMVLMAMVGAARGVRYKRHTQLDGVANALPRPLSIGLKTITSLITLIFLGVFVWSSMLLITRAGGLKTPYLRLQYGKLYYSMPVGGF